MKQVLTLFALTAALAMPARAQSITIGGQTYTESTNAAGQTILTAAGPASPASAGSLSTNANPILTVFDYFTSFNQGLTNAFATNNNYQVWMGASYSAATFLGGTIGAEAQPINKLHGLTFRNADTLAPVVGTIADADFAIGYALVYVDTRTLPFIGLDVVNRNGNINQPSSVCFDGGVEFEKAISANGFGGIYFEGRTRTKGALIIGFITGLTF